VLILVRHGRTALNAAGRLQGRIDEPLDDVGYLQAKAVAERVGPVDELIASPLLRAQQTAEAFGLPYELDDRWIELAYGVYDGMPTGEVPSEIWRRWREQPEFEPEGGESLAALDLRVRSACVDVAERARDRAVVVVSHVSPIKAAVGWALGAGIELSWRSHLSQASITRIDIRRAGPILFTFNEAPLLG
jgi:broad specificity phosphatase PhoE